MQTLNCVSMPLNLKGKSSIFGLLIAALLICGIYFTGSAFLTRDFRMLSFGTEVNQTRQVVQSDKCKISLSEEMNNTRKNMTQGDKCKKQYRAVGSEPLPEGIVAPTTNLEMRPLYGPIVENINTKTAVNLLAIAVGVKQKELVNQMVRKFLDNGFVVMLFHYDLAVDDWNDLEWSSRVIHVSAMNQTKWWFAKRFLHPDIVADYDYIFLWDEDFGVENFHPGRYVSIIKEEGLEISQPALDRRKSGVHHEITKRKRNLKVHRRIIKKGHVACDGNSTSPPCTGWVEMMAPVFSRAAWRCAWYMIQNDLIHAWGLDIQLGYCAQGDRTKNVGVVDAEYIVHLGVPSLGALGQDKVPSSNIATIRAEVRRQSYYEMDIFRERWKRAVEKDKCWIDPYLKPLQQKKQ